MSLDPHAGVAGLMPQAAGAQEPAAAMLRQARQAAGVHLAVLSANLKVPVQRLEALEQGRYGDLPNMTFVRTLAQSVCRQLRIDPAPVLAALPPATADIIVPVSQLTDSAYSAPAASSAASVEVTKGKPLPRAGIAAALLALLAAVLWWWLPGGGAGRQPATVASVPPTEAAASLAAVPQGQAPAADPSATGAASTPALAATETVAGAPPAGGAAGASTPATPASASAPVAAVGGSSSSALPAGPVASQAPSATPAVSASAPVALVADASGSLPPDAKALLRITARELSWVEVTNAAGKLLVQRHLQPGETVGFNSGSPYGVVVGRADATEVLVRGQRVDLAAVARANVARLSVP